MSGPRLHGHGLTFEDTAIGAWLDTASLTVTEDHIDAFAALTGDRFEIHISDKAARRHGFAARVAHGLLVLSLVDGLKNQAEARFLSVASLGWTWRFNGPVLVGDTIAARLEVVGRRETRKADRAILSLRFTVRNQRGETVQSGDNQLMVYRRQAGSQKPPRYDG